MSPIAESLTIAIFIKTILQLHSYYERHILIFTFNDIINNEKFIIKIDNNEPSK